MIIRSTVFAFASLLAVAPLAHAAQGPLPGQPGADTSLGQELRGQPYPATTERSQFKPVLPAMKATQNTGPGIYDTLSLPANLIFS